MKTLAAVLFLAASSASRAGGRDLRGKDLRRADLRGADLVTADLTGADLRGARLAGSDLTNARLDGANLSGADLSNAVIGGASLRRALLDEARLDGASLMMSDLAGASLARTSLLGTDLSEVRLDDAILAGAVFDRRSSLPIDEKSAAARGMWRADAAALAASPAVAAGPLLSAGAPLFKTFEPRVPAALRRLGAGACSFVSHRVGEPILSDPRDEFPPVLIGAYHFAETWSCGGVAYRFSGYFKSVFARHELAEEKAGNLQFFVVSLDEPAR